MLVGVTKRIWTAITFAVPSWPFSEPRCIPIDIGKLDDQTAQRGKLSPSLQGDPTNRLIPLRSDQLRIMRAIVDAAMQPHRTGLSFLSLHPRSLQEGQSRRGYCSVRRKQQWSHKIFLTEDPIVAATEIRSLIGTLTCI